MKYGDQVIFYMNLITFRIRFNLLCFSCFHRLHICISAYLRPRNTLLFQSICFEYDQAKNGPWWHSGFEHDQAKIGPWWHGGFHSLKRFVHTLRVYFMCIVF